MAKLQFYAKSLHLAKLTQLFASSHVMSYEIHQSYHLYITLCSNMACTLFVFNQLLLLQLWNVQFWVLSSTTTSSLCNRYLWNLIFLMLVQMPGYFSVHMGLNASKNKYELIICKNDCRICIWNLHCIQ